VWCVVDRGGGWGKRELYLLSCLLRMCNIKVNAHHQKMEEAPTSCANCGKTEELEDELKACNACKLVKYCSRDCQIAHRSQHKNACRKRAAELHDEALFRQPPEGDDCPICFLLLPTLPSGKTFMPCCGKMICSGCCHVHLLQSNGSATCPFCRADIPYYGKEVIKMLEERVDGNDSDAIYNLGRYYFEGDEDCGVKKNVDKAAKLFHRAADLGSAQAYHNLGVMYARGDDVCKDDTKAKHYYEKATMAGCVTSRCNLGSMDANAGSFDRAIKHWLIAARFGDINAVNNIKEAMADGDATRDHYAQALRGYTQYMNYVRSDQRDKAAAYSDANKYLPDM
jgi:hypothetical protein